MSNKNSLEVRKLPKKTVITIIIMTIILFAGYAFIVFTKNMKMEEVLEKLGHEKISNIEVINKMVVEDIETKIKSTVYKVRFVDESTKKECIGFVHRSNRGKYSKDIDCK